MTRALQKLLAEMEADGVLGGAVAAGFRVGLERLDWEADTSPDSAALFEALDWIASQPRTLNEKFAVICRLLALRGRVTIRMREFSGW